MAACPALRARALEPLVSGLWIFFLLWTAWIAVVWAFALGDASLDGLANRDLRAVLVRIIGAGDIAWITLAAASVHLWLAETEGLATARRWALIVGSGVMALGAVSAFTGWPLGAIQYSAQLGVKVGPVPVGLPLLWYALIVGARQTVLWRWPSAGPGPLALLAEVNLEPVAAKLRGFWLWRAADPAQPPVFTAPWTAYAAWALTAAALAFFLREERVVTGPRRAALRPVIIFALLNAVFLAAHAGRWLRG